MKPTGLTIQCHKSTLIRHRRHGFPKRPLWKRKKASSSRSQGKAQLTPVEWESTCGFAAAIGASRRGERQELRERE